MKKVIVLLALAFAGIGAKAQQMEHSTMKTNILPELARLLKKPRVQMLSKDMRMLWNEHMYWTLITVDAYYNDPKGLEAKLNHLLQNQKDIGAAIVPYYGQAAGDKLGQLLTEHIQDAVPVLEAARKNDKAALDKAVKDWYANAKEIGDFLASANPKYWNAKETESALEMHITQTIGYSVDIQKGDYAQAFQGFEEALHHMLMLSDILTYGIVRQFPGRF